MANDDRRYPDKLWAHIRPLSVNQASFYDAAKEWEFAEETEETDDDVDCPCGHKHIHMLCHIVNGKTGATAIVGNECINWFGAHLAEVVHLARSLLSITGEYKGFTRSGYQLQFQVHARLSALAQQKILKGYFRRLPWLKVGPRYRLFVYDKRGTPRLPLQVDVKYRLALRVRSSYHRDGSLMLELVNAILLE
jgi:hypothetical protein